MLASRRLFETGYNRAGSIHLVAQRRLDARVGWQVHIDARAEADKAVALPAREFVSRLDIAQDAPRDQASHLHAGDVNAGVGTDPQRIALVFGRRLVQRGVDETAGVVKDLLYLAVHRRAIGVNVEHVHEYANLDRVAVEVGIARFLHRHDAPVRGRHHRLRITRYLAPGVAEKLQHEHGDEPERNRPKETEPGHQRRRGAGEREEGPAFPGDKGVRIIHRQEADGAGRGVNGALALTPPSSFLPSSLTGPPTCSSGSTASSPAVSRPPPRSGVRR